MTRLLRLLQRLPAGLWLYWGFLFALLYLFSQLAEEVVEREPIAFDQAILEALDRWRTPGLDLAAGVLNVVGGSYFLLPLTAIVSIALWRRRPRSAVFLGLAVLGAVAINGLAKLYFERVRPESFEGLVSAEGFAFPSGHAMGSTAAALAAYFLIRAHAPALRWSALALGAVFALAVGVSRSYLLVHYPSDVVAGWILATAWVLGVHAAFSAGPRGWRGYGSPPPTAEASETKRQDTDTRLAIPADPRPQLLHVRDRRLTPLAPDLALHQRRPEIFGRIDRRVREIGPGPAHFLECVRVASGGDGFPVRIGPRLGLPVESRQTDASVERFDDVDGRHDLVPRVRPESSGLAGVEPVWQ